MQAEQSVLGAALVDETVLNRLITDMEPEMFYSDQNRAIYETMRSLYTESEAVDIVTLVNALASNKTLASADDAKVYLARIAETLPSVSNVDSYFKIVKEKYQGRRLIDAARSILNETASGEDADLLLESAEQKDVYKRQVQRIEIFGQVYGYGVSVSFFHIFFYLLNRLLGAPFRTVAIAAV